MNPAAILALISDLYTQIGTLTAEVERLTTTPNPERET